jgi:putative spermidine/putrescine transport system substrate-binding protein
MQMHEIVAACAAAAAMASATARPLTIANFGGANGRAQAVAFQQPFERGQSTAVAAVEYTGDLAQLRKMVKDGKPAWDIVEVESADLGPGCEAGLFERIDRSKLAHAGLMLPGAVQDCGVGAFVWSTVLAYDAARLKDAPRTWADFWDVARFPGKRGLRKGARYNLEFALLADGVNRADVYRLLSTEAGVARALRKLEALKPHIVWWESGAQPPKMLAAGEVAMSTAFNGRIAAANREGTGKLEIVWADAIYELDYWAIVKGSPQRDLALGYINFATSEEAQLAFSREITYGPTNFNAILRYDSIRKPASSAHHALIDLSMVGSELPSAPANMRKSLAFDPGFWTRNGAAIERRFSEAFR